MEELGRMLCQLQIVVYSDFNLRNHAPLWLIWPLLALSLSLYPLSVYIYLEFGLSLFPSGAPAFLGSWEIFSVLHFSADAMAFLLVLVCAMVKKVLVASMIFESSLGSLLAMLWLSRFVGFLSDPLKFIINLIYIRYDLLISTVEIKISLFPSFAYKLRDYQLHTNMSLFHMLIHSPLSEIFVNDYLVGTLNSDMALVGSPGKKKGKEKIPVGIASSPDGSVKINTKSTNTNSTNSTNLPTLKLPLGGSTSKSKAKSGMGSKNRPDLTTMFKKLATTRENGQKRKELTLLGFLVGEPKDFARLFAKLRMEWKPLQGSMTLSVLKFGWFEIFFSNSSDFNLIWNNRPYHVFSQLLLLKQWYPGFDPTSESISQLDLWVRLHYLPEEFANADALETIIEGNWMGSFLKMDPSHNSERWNMFTRFCINTDVEMTFGKGVIVPDEHFNKIKYTLWFDDCSPGCGACGKSAHTFRECPNKNAQNPTLKLTIRKPSSKKKASEEAVPQFVDNVGWNMMGKNNKVVKHSNIAIPRGSIYLSERSGINVTYESEESEEGIQHMLENEADSHEQPNLVSLAADLHPYNLFSEGNNNLKLNVDKNYSKLIPVVDPNQSQELIKTDTTEDNMNISKTMEILETTSPKQRISMDGGISGMGSSQETTVAECPAKSSEKTELQEQSLDHPQICAISTMDVPTPQLLEEDITEYDEEQFDYEYDDLLVDDIPEFSHPNLLPSTSVNANNPILISEDPSFSEKDLDMFINNEVVDVSEGRNNSDGTFHSMLNSIHSSSSFVNNMEKLLVYKSDKSTSNSSKRKMIGNVEDTATSEKRAGKKTKY